MTQVECIYEDTTSYEDEDTAYFEDTDSYESNTTESTQSLDTQDSDEDKPSRLKHLKLKYKAQNFVKGLFTVKLSRKDLDSLLGRKKTKSPENFQPSEASIKPTQNESSNKKKRIRKKKALVEKRAGDSEITTRKSSKNECEITTVKEGACCPKKSEILCDICMEPLYRPFKPLLYHANCFTWFHKDCVEAHVRASIKLGNIPVPCPQEGCTKELDEKKMALFLTEEEFKAYSKKVLAHNVMVHHDKFMFCTTPNCEHIFEISRRESKLDCPTCKKSSCGNCRVPYHKTLTCREYNTLPQHDVATYLMMGEMNWTQCTKCRFWIEKNQGCNHMTCKCTNQFCYVCSAPWKTCHCPQY